MSESKRYYWLKLKRDFFRRHDIQIVENMPNGKDYILFYLKLLCESVDHNGNLRFSEQIPYNEQMLATITNTNIDVVRSAIRVFEELGMMEVLDDGTYFMSEVQKMLGSETKWAEKKRDYRLKKGQCPQGVLPMSDKSKRESIEKDTDKEKEKENTKEISPSLDSGEMFDFEEAFNKTFEIYPKKKSYSKAKKTWLDKLLGVIDENRADVARLIYGATIAYLHDYKSKNPDDTEFRYLPQYADWLINDCDYWLGVVEKRNGK
nr:MAG TPA: Replication initiation and membrane attachment [Caudoviricetes sp.]